MLFENTDIRFFQNKAVAWPRTAPSLPNADNYLSDAGLLQMSSGAQKDLDPIV